MYYENENVVNLDRIFDQNSREEYLRMDLNENPVGLPEDFIKEVLDGVTPGFVGQYPETMAFTQMLGDWIGAELEEICLTNGSAEGIRHIIEAYTQPGGNIVAVHPSYAMYEVYAKMYGRNVIPVEYDDDMNLSMDDIIAKLNPDVDMVIILNPNNPIGNVYSYEEMDRLVAAAKENEVTVLIDEAYFYFYTNSFVKYALENDHVFLTRTFSKLFSLAGCRLGYVVGQKEGIALIQKLCTPHNVNAWGIRFANAIIQKEGMVEELMSKQKAGKQYLVDRLQELGYTLNIGEGNFIFVKPRFADADEIVRRMKAEKMILIKSYHGIKGMNDCLRVTTGEESVMKIFVDALVDLDKE